MNGPGHYLKAEQYAADAAELLAAIGQVHATLAAAAATALSAISRDVDAWSKVAGTKPTYGPEADR